MLRKKILLHLGMHKTGTTAIQSFCKSHHELLKGSGVLYPESGRPVLANISFGHHLLPWTFTHHSGYSAAWPSDLSSPDEIWARLKDEIDATECDRVLISSEEFDTLSPRQVWAVLGQLSKYEVVPIIYVRRIDEFIQAMYTTEVVHSGEKRFIEHFIPLCRTPLNYEDIILPWARALGSSPIVRFYTKDLARGGILSDFLSIIDVHTSAVDPEEKGKRLNVGCWPWFVIELCRQLNAQGRSRELVVQLAHRFGERFRMSGEYELLSPAEAQKWALHGVASLRRLSQSLGLDDLPDEFTHPTMRAPNTESEYKRLGEEGAIFEMLDRMKPGRTE